MQAIYEKTPKGVEEMSTRRYGLSQRERMVLLMVNGLRPHQELSKLLPGEEGETALQRLIQEGFVAPLQATVSKPAELVKTFERPEDAQQRFEMARNIMRNSINALLGGMGSGLINQISKCTTIDELRAHYKAWHESINMTRDGRKQSADLEKHLAVLFS